ncbi:glycosyltransferase [bacterium]|nr:glycosyltransferase [bacterium]
MSSLHRGTPNGAVSTPELSIVVSCFNQADQLEPALRECFATLQPVVRCFETIIINDGSTDGSVRILDRLRKEFPHLRVTHQLHSGEPRALRRGYDLARGEYIFQFDLNCLSWVADFPRLWERRDRYALILGHHKLNRSRLNSASDWLFARWIKLWFGAELKAPESVFRLCETEQIRPYLQSIPKEFEEVSLGVTLTYFRDFPRRILELEMVQPAAKPRFQPSRQLSKFLHYFQEVPALRVKRAPQTTLQPSTASV